MRLRSILCPVDFSEPSRDALRHAAEIARRSGGRLSVMFVNDRLLLAAAAGALYRRPRFFRRSQAALERFVNASIPAVPGGAIGCHVAEGDPAIEILSEAKRLKSDLIVMGTHGLRGLDKLFFGSTTEQVLRRATLPVLAVPSSKKRAPWARVVVPLDPDGSWDDELKAAAALARLFLAPLALVHVVPRTQTPPWLRESVAAHDRKRVARARRAMAHIRAQVPPDLKSTSRVLLGDPASEIAAVAANGPAPVIVMGLRHGARARLGSTTQQVLTRGVAPVLAVPELV